MIAACGISLATQPTASGETIRWVGPAGGYWYAPEHWDLGRFPNGRDSVVFDIHGGSSAGVGLFAQVRTLEINAGDVALLMPSAYSELRILEETESLPAGLRILSEAGSRTRLFTDAPMYAFDTFVGGAGDAVLTTTNSLWVRSLTLGGDIDLTPGYGELNITGEGASWRTNTATIGLSGSGVASIDDGASAQIEDLRLALEPMSDAELDLDGVETEVRLGIEQQTHTEVRTGLGDSFIRIGNGARLLSNTPHMTFSADSFFDGTNAYGGSTTLFLDGGALEGATNLSFGFSSANVDRLWIDGGSSLSLNWLSFSGDLVIEDGELDVELLRVVNGDELVLGAQSNLRAQIDRGEPFHFDRVSIVGGQVLLDVVREQSDPRFNLDLFYQLLRGDVMEIRDATLTGRPAIGVIVDEHATINDSVIESETVFFNTNPFPGQSKLEPLGIVSIIANYNARITLTGLTSIRARRVQLGGEIALLVPAVSIEADEAIVLRELTSVRLSNSPLRAEVVAISQSSRITGSGVIAADVLNGGEIAPEIPLRHTAKIEIIGDLDQDGGRIPPLFDRQPTPSVPAGSIQLEFSDQYGEQIDVSGVAALGGSCILEFDATYPRAQYRVLSAASISGVFSTVEFVNLTEGYRAWIEYSPKSVDVFVRKFGDIDGDRVTDADDLGRLLTNWNGADRASDLNEDGLIDGADLAVLLAHWSTD